MEEGITGVAKEFDLYRTSTSNSMNELKEKVQSLVLSLTRKTEEVENINTEWKITQGDNAHLKQQLARSTEENQKLKQEISNIGSDIDQIKTR